MIIIPMRIIRLAPILSIKTPSIGPNAAPSALLKTFPIEISVRDQEKFF